MPTSLIESLGQLAEDAGRLIMKHYEQGVKGEIKSDGSPVTVADREAEALITAGLHHLTPSWPVIGEEAASVGALPNIHGQRYWLVDPLDGTREFLTRSDDFAVSIGLIDNERPILGVVCAPATNDLWTGDLTGRTPRATHRSPGKETHKITVRPARIKGLTVVTSRNHNNESALERYLSGLKVKERCLRGSALKFGLIALGEADLYPRFGTTREWDTAGGQAILTAAGGKVVTAEGWPLRYGKPNFSNPSFIACGGSASHER
ncbi:3'(2'),5'-bisphosphate nucleotidase CysQ [Azospirillaceae bacterium]